MRKKIFIFSALVVLVDQLVKMLVMNFLSLNEQVMVIRNFFYLFYVHNEGAAWNIFSGNRYFLIIISILALYAIIKYFLLDVNITKIEFYGYFLILGGILGNFIDRVVYGYVIDYLSFHILSYNFPIFNIADSAIVIGSLLIMFHLFRKSNR